MNHPDFFDDRNEQVLNTINNLTGLPSFVKGAELSSEDLPSLSSDVFADPIHRKHACHTKAATWLANAYFQLDKTSYPKEEAELVQGRLNKFAAYWDIKNDLTAYNNSLTKKAEAPVCTEFAIDMRINNPMTHAINHVQRYPINTPAAVKQAAESLYINRFKFPYAMRKQAACNIFRKQAEYGMAPFDWDVAAYIEKAAGCGATLPAMAARHLNKRAMLLGKSQEELRTKIAALAASMTETAHLGTAQLSKLAEAVDVIDRETGLNKTYKDGLEMPEEVFFAVRVKEAEAALADHVRLQTGKVYKLAELAAMPLEKISSVLGEDFVDSVKSNGKLDLEKFADVLPTLPRDDAMLLERAINASKTDRNTKVAALNCLVKKAVLSLPAPAEIPYATVRPIPAEPVPVGRGTVTQGEPGATLNENTQGTFKQEAPAAKEKAPLADSTERGTMTQNENTQGEFNQDRGSRAGTHAGVSEGATPPRSLVDSIKQYMMKNPGLMMGLGAAGGIAGLHYGNRALEAYENNLKYNSPWSRFGPRESMAGYPPGYGMGMNGMMNNDMGAEPWLPAMYRNMEQSRQMQMGRMAYMPAPSQYQG